MEERYLISPQIEAVEYRRGAEYQKECKKERIAAQDRLSALARMVVEVADHLFYLEERVGGHLFFEMKYLSDISLLHHKLIHPERFRCFQPDDQQRHSKDRVKRD